jgi:transcriptional regulator with XRE-family HTH domain
MKGLGTRIKTLRQARKLTLVAVARKTGIDQATLSRIENGKMTGTLDSHMKIAEVFGMSLPELYQEVLEKITETREKETRRKVETFSHSSGAVAELLTTGILRKKMMPILLRIRKGGRTEREEYPPMTERFVYVIKGALDIHVGDGSRTLAAGESLYFDASQPHHFTNASKTEAVCLSVMTPASP